MGIYELSDLSFLFIKTKKTKIRRNDEAFTHSLPLCHSSSEWTKIALFVVPDDGKAYIGTPNRRGQSTTH